MDGFWPSFLFFGKFRKKVADNTDSREQMLEDFCPRGEYVRIRGVCTPWEAWRELRKNYDGEPTAFFMERPCVDLYVPPPQRPAEASPTFGSAETAPCSAIWE